MARTTMAALIQALRALVGDPAVPGYQRTDDELQAALDRHRERYLDWPLTAEPVIGSAQNEWSANGIGDWEERTSPPSSTSAVIRDAAGVEVVPSSADWRLGYWSFAADQSALYITGYSYDLHAAAADVLGEELAAARGLVDFSGDGVSVSASQKVANLETLRKMHAGQSRALGGGSGALTVVRLERSDGGRRRDWASGG